MPAQPSPLAHLKPLFILGLPRSGTTLLMSLLDGHGQILAAMGDSRFFKWYFGTRFHSPKRRARQAERVLLHMFRPEGAYYRRLLSHIPHAQVFQEFRTALAASAQRPRDYLEATLAALAKASRQQADGLVYWLEKTPHNEYHLRRICTWWPEAVFIHMVRDPRDVYSSYIQRDLAHHRRPTSPTAFAFAWAKSVRALQDYRHMLGEDRYLPVRYEELAERPEQVMRATAAFLDIAWESGLQRPTKGGGRFDWAGNAATGQNYSRVQSSAVGKWRRLLTPAKAKVLEGLLHREMAAMGYSTDSRPARPPLARLGLALRAVKFRLLHL